MGRPPRVILIDVHDEVRRPLAVSLDRQEEFEVVLATGEPAQAIERSTELAPDLLLVDIRQLDKAVSICQELHQISSQAKLVILSSFVSEWEQSMFEEVGAMAFLSKEGSFQSLLTDLRGQLGEVLGEPSV